MNEVQWDSFDEPASGDPKSIKQHDKIQRWPRADSGTPQLEHLDLTSLSTPQQGYETTNSVLVDASTNPLQVLLQLSTPRALSVS